MSYKGVDVFGRVTTFTLPCNSPLPAGAVCVCNCVPGAITIPHTHAQQFDPVGNCTNHCLCDLICTCNTIPTTPDEGHSFLGGRGNRRASPPASASSSGGKVCVCVPVCTCQAV